MSTGTYTRDRTFSVADIKDVLGSFGADFGMVVSSSAVGGWPRSHIDVVLADLVMYAKASYLAAIDVTLLSSTGVEVKAARYNVSENAYGWSTDRPGNSLWPRNPAGRIRLTAIFASSWAGETASSRESFKRSLNLSWSDSDDDLSHADLTGRLDRRFASNGFGLEKLTYG